MIKAAAWPPRPRARASPSGLRRRGQARCRPLASKRVRRPYDVSTPAHDIAGSRRRQALRADAAPAISPRRRKMGEAGHYLDDDAIRCRVWQPPRYAAPRRGGGARCRTIGAAASRCSLARLLLPLTSLNCHDMGLSGARNASISRQHADCTSVKQMM